jgi:hypothetical protein
MIQQTNDCQPSEVRANLKFSAVKRHRTIRRPCYPGQDLKQSGLLDSAFTDARHIKLLISPFIAKYYRAKRLDWISMASCYRCANAVARGQPRSMSLNGSESMVGVSQPKNAPHEFANGAESPQRNGETAESRISSLSAK